MDVHPIESSLSFANILAQTTLGIGSESKEERRLRNACELARLPYVDTASVPEKLFVMELIEYLVRFEPDLEVGFFSEEEAEELNDESFNYWEEKGDVLEIFVNPKNLFLEGKIRPDVVFRRGKGKYIVFEVDSFLHHSSQEALMKDKIRERKIQSLGYPVYRFAAKEILERGGAYKCMIEAIETLQKHKFVKKLKKKKVKKEQNG